MTKSLEQELSNLIEHWKQTSADIADWEEGKQLRESEKQLLESLFRGEKRKAVNKLMLHVVHQTQAHMCREYEKLFTETLDKNWPQHKKVKLKLVKVNKEKHNKNAQCTTRIKTLGK